MAFGKKTLNVSVRRQETQPNDIQPNDIQPNDIQHNDIQQKGP
jgi:hypothetical protein